MTRRSERRRLIQGGLTTGVLYGLGDFSFLSRLPAVTAAEATPEPGLVHFRPEIEPVVRLLEETPREQLLEAVAARIRAGLSYQDALAAVFLAGVRNVEPRPSVGFKFHAVLVVNSAHLASLAASDAERWLPLFWAMDYFKTAQAQNVRERNGWRMPAVRSGPIPVGEKAIEAFTSAMDQWDEEAADVAAAGLVRSLGANAVFDLFCRYGGRDFRAIGHKIIYVANSWRTLACVGWHHAEPVVRSLAYALLSHDGGNPAQRDDPADRPARYNQDRAETIRAGWQDGRLDEAATRDLLAVLRSGSADDASAKVVALLNGGVAPQSIWDALFAASGEMVMRQPGIVSLHTATTTNAFRFAFDHCGEPLTRRWLLLQNASFLPMFRDAMAGRGRVGTASIEELAPIEVKGTGADAVAEIFADVSRDKQAAAAKMLGYLRRRPAEEIIDGARALVFLKGRDAHDYKYSSAVLEDYRHVSPAWRDRVLATSAFLLRGSGERDNPLGPRVRNAFQA